MKEEGLQDTPNKLIHIGKPIEFDIELFQQQLKDLYELANMDTDQIGIMVKKLVPTYQQQE